MKQKKTLLFVYFTLVWTFLTLHTATFAAYDEEGITDSITLQEPPYSIGEGWTLDTTYSSNAPYALAKGNQEYVAVGPYGTVMKSIDGLNWKALSKFGNYHLTAIAWDGSKYVMFGANAEYEREARYTPSETFISTDALNWQKINFDPEEPIQQLVWGNKEFVALGNKHAFTSADGVNWSKTLTLPDQNGWYALGHVHDTYFLFDYNKNKVSISKDGREWTTKPFDTAANIRDLVWTGDHYIGVGSGVFTSTDGVNWKKQANSPRNASLQNIFTDGKSYIAVGTIQQNGSTLKVSYTSNDGVSWKQHDLSKLHLDIYTLYPVNGGFAGIGSKDIENVPDGTYSIFTKDGIHWSYRLAGTSRAGDFNAVAFNGKRAVAVGLQGSVIYTDDGSRWRASNPFSYRGGMGRVNLFDIVWGGNQFVAVGNGGAYVSPDGVSWKKANVPFRDEFGDLTKILWTGTFFVASDQVYGVYVSEDGLNWTQVKSVSNDWLTSMIWDGKRVVAAFQVYNNGNQYMKIMQTTNGTQWTELEKIDVIVAELAWNGKRYIAYYPYDATKMWMSDDGNQWAKAAVNLDHNDRFAFATSFDGAFFAFNDSLLEINGEYTVYDAYYVSRNGVEWKEISIPKKHPDFDINGNEIMADGIHAYGKYIFVGSYGLKMYASELQLEDPILIKVNGQELPVTSELGKPYIQANTTYVPLKLVGTALGYEVIWDQANQKVAFKKDGTSVDFSDIQLKNGRSYVPLRKISESLGYLVNYERTNQEIVITIDNR